jgi:small multidrug resistance family-3 protein
MERLLIIGGLFVVAGLCEIGGSYLVWALLGAMILATYGAVAALRPVGEFGRVYAAYGGIFLSETL